MARGLIFSFGVPLVNLVAVSLGAFVATLVREGLSAEPASQLIQAIGLMFSLGMLLCVLAAALVAFGGWQLVRRSGPGVGGAIGFGVGVLISALLPVVFSLFVLGLPLGTTVVLVTTGLFAVAMRPRATAERVPQARFSPVAPGPAQAGFGRRV